MRNFKFRAWDTKKQQMTGFEFAITSKGRWLSKDFSEKEEAWRREKTSRLIPMQSIGLFDKNNREIYEGDFLLSVRAFKSVVWDQKRACFAWGTDHVRDLHESTAGKMEVIGNIWENPDLLKN